VPNLSCHHRSALANKEVHEAFRDGVPGKEGCEKIHFSAIVILNYLDGIAIGVHQGLYVEELARDHLKDIVCTRVRNLLETAFAQEVKFDPHDWCFLTAMASARAASDNSASGFAAASAPKRCGRRASIRACCFGSTGGGST
jgi:hypothetical protein